MQEGALHESHAVRATARRVRDRVFEHAGTYRKRLPDGYRARNTVFVRGTLGADDRWSGTFRVRTRVTRNGQVVDRCRLKGVRWAAEAV